MKVFKTILWTTLFWLLVICGLRVASFFFPEEASIIIPEKVKNVIIESAAGIECATLNGEERPVEIQEVTQEEILPVEEQIEEPEIEDIIPEEVIEDTTLSQTTKNSLIPQKTSSNDDVKELENRVYELEGKYDDLVDELQTIFSTPLFTQLLNEAFQQTDETITE